MPPASSSLLRVALLGLNAAFAALLFATRRATSWPRLILAGLLPAAAGAVLIFAAVRIWPLHAREMSLVRAATATLAVLALVRGAVWAQRWPAHQAPVLAALVTSAALAVGAFYNLGWPQVWNERAAAPEFVNTVDMFIYHPFAKYFRELGYDGVYLANLAAYLDDAPAGTRESIGSVDVRDLRDHRLVRVSTTDPRLDAVRARFSPERWREYRRDLGYFRDRMGVNYLRALSDLGANATPFWVLCAQAVFAGRPASELWLILGALLDPILLALMFVAVARTFGVRVMLLALVIFGASDLPVFVPAWNLNWAGSTLRQDWLAWLGLGVCALRVERWRLAGCLLGLSVLSRALPAAALAGVAFTALAHRHRGAMRTLLAAAAVMLAGFVVTGCLFSFGAWRDWFDKVALLDSGVTQIEASLRAALAGTALRPLYRPCAALGVAAVALACRHQRPDRAALLALPLIPILFHPAGYYDHFVFLLPLLGPSLPLALPLLAACMAQGWTSQEVDVLRHFHTSSVILFLSLGGVLAAAGRSRS